MQWQGERLENIGKKHAANGFSEFFGGGFGGGGRLKLAVIGIQGEIIYAPPLPHFWPKGIFQGRGVGVYILRPRAAGILYAPPFYTPPTPRRVFSGVGGWGCIKIGPVW